jgi:hypothetical protein
MIVSDYVTPLERFFAGVPEPNYRSREPLDVGAAILDCNVSRQSIRGKA